MSIRCGHCKGRHETAAEVRTCATARPAQERPAAPAGTEARPSGQAAEEGVYRRGDRIFRVVVKAGKTHAVAEEMIRGTYVYAKGWVFRLTPADRLTLEQAREWGRTEIRCIRCGTALEKRESREAGIGPVCATKV